MGVIYKNQIHQTNPLLFISGTQIAQIKRNSIFLLILFAKMFFFIRKNEYFCRHKKH